MLRPHGTAHLLGIVLGATGAIATLLASLGCQPTDTDDVLGQHLSRSVTGGEGYHLTITISRAALDQTTSGLWFYASATSADGAATIALVADDAALDEEITNDSSSAHLMVSDLASVCPAEGDCALGLTVLTGGSGRVDTSLSADVRRPLSAGRFTDDATLTIVED